MRARREPTRRKVDLTVDGTVDGKTVDVTLVCTSCNHGDQVSPFVLTESFAKQTKAESCLWCGRLGAMKQKGVAA